jgi:hypothetical protein
MKTLGSGLMLGLLLAALSGCQSRAPAPAPVSKPQPAVSSGEGSGLAQPASAPQAPAENSPLRSGTMRFLVVHDAEGRPVYVELKQGSGDPALDRRARLYVMEELRFPSGKTGTVTISIEPDEVPPLPAGLQP